MSHPPDWIYRQRVSTATKMTRFEYADSIQDEGIELFILFLDVSENWRAISPEHQSSTGYFVKSNWDSSDRGTVMGFSGATRDFPIRNAQWMRPFLLKIRTYETAPYALREASEKWCNWHDAIWTKSGGFRQRLTINSDNVGKSANNLF